MPMSNTSQYTNPKTKPTTHAIAFQAPHQRKPLYLHVVEPVLALAQGSVSQRLRVVVLVPTQPVIFGGPGALADVVKQGPVADEQVAVT